MLHILIVKELKSGQSKLIVHFLVDNQLKIDLVDLLPSSLTLEGSR